MSEKRGLSLQEFRDLLEGYLEREREWRPHDRVAVRLSNPSIGFSAITHVTPGFDWDSGTLFLGTALPVVHAAKVSRDQIRAAGKERAEFDKAHGGFAHRKSDVYEDGFFEGALWGLRKLLDHNTPDPAPKALS